jgi:hypothetical protein
MKKLIVVIFLWCCVCVAQAAEFGGNVTNLYINSSGSVFFKLVNSSGSSSSNCPDGLWPFSFNTDAKVAKEWLSMLLSAKATGEKLVVGFSVPDAGQRCKATYLYFRP